MLMGMLIIYVDLMTVVSTDNNLISTDCDITKSAIIAHHIR